MKLIYIVLASVVLVSAETLILKDSVTEQQTVDIRKIVEEWTPQVSHLIIKNHLDPYDLPSMQTEFWVPFPGIPLISYKAQLTLHSGKLNGISNLKFNKAILTYENKVVKLAIDIEFSLLKLAYNYDLKLRILKPKGTITADAKVVKANTIIAFNTTDYTLALDEFQLQPLNIKNVLIQDQSGWKFLIISAVANIVAALDKNRITKEVQIDVAKAIRAELSEINRNVPPEKLAQFFQNLLLEF